MKDNSKKSRKKAHEHQMLTTIRYREARRKIRVSKCSTHLGPVDALKNAGPKTGRADQDEQHDARQLGHRGVHRHGSTAVDATARQRRTLGHRPRPSRRLRSASTPRKDGTGAPGEEINAAAAGSARR